MLPLLLLLAAPPPSPETQQSETWHLAELLPKSSRVLGSPQIVDTPHGKALSFNGSTDAIYINSHPLSGKSTFTWEVIFLPAPGGNPEQRFFHLSSRDPKTGEDLPSRMLFETRLIGDRWCLDSYVYSPAGALALLDHTKLHPTGQWHHIAMVYDGKTLRHYINHVLQGEGPLAFSPQLPGHSSIGTRINQKDFFKGLVLKSRFTHSPLTPKEFWPVPPSKPI
jgi:hypothetical protein